MRLIDGRTVWALKATHGLPLDMSLMKLAQNDLVPTWDALFEAAAEDGCNLRRLKDELKFFVLEAYAPEIASEINQRLEALLLRLN